MRKYLELFKNGFDSTLAEKTKVENWPYVGYSPSEGVVYTIIPKEDGTMYTIYRVVRKDISNCTYNMVDLGLPSGLKWADRNVGATSPEHYGSYFQWGDTNAYTFDGAGEVTAAKLAEMLNPTLSPELGMEITADNIGAILEQMGMTSKDLTPVGMICSLDKLFNWDSYNEVDEITSWEEYDDGYKYPGGFNKYNNSEESLKVLESVDDAAAVHMGSQYRMPTIDEIEELRYNTTHTYIDLNGNEYIQEEGQNETIEYGKLKGVRLTGSNGNSIFIPAASSCNASLLNETGTGGALWASSLYDSYDSIDYYACMWGFHYDSGGVFVGHYDRYYGNSVRGVQE